MQDHAYLYLRLCLRGTVHGLYCLSTVMKAQGYSGDKASGLISIRIV